MSGIFRVNFAHLLGYNARTALSEIDKIPSKIYRPGINIFCGLGSYSRVRHSTDFFVNLQLMNFLRLISKRPMVLGGLSLISG